MSKKSIADYHKLYPFHSSKVTAINIYVELLFSKWNLDKYIGRIKLHTEVQKRQVANLPGHIFLRGNQSLPVLSKTPTNQIDGFCWSKLWCGKRLDSLGKSFPSICDLEGVKSGKVCFKKAEVNTIIQTQVYSAKSSAGRAILFIIEIQLDSDNFPRPFWSVQKLRRRIVVLGMW